MLINQELYLSKSNRILNKYSKTNIFPKIDLKKTNNITQLS